MYLNAPRPIGQTFHYIKVRSGMRVSVSNSVLRDSPCDAVQSASKCHSPISAHLVNRDVQFSDSGRRTAGRKPVSFDRSYTHHCGASVSGEEHRILSKGFEHSLGVVREPRGTVPFDGRLDRPLIVNREFAGVAVRSTKGLPLPINPRPTITMAIHVLILEFCIELRASSDT